MRLLNVTSKKLQIYICRYNRLSRMKEKSDVSSFGVVLLEIITGQPAITKTETMFGEQDH
jgi:hypothetical protein